LLNDHHVPEDNIQIASGSKDGSIRIWQLKNSEQNKPAVEKNSELFELKVESHIFGSKEIILTSVLSGHNGQISSVYWCRDQEGESLNNGKQY